MSTKVTASRYNNIQRRINAILGRSSGSTPQSGYGQSVRSNTHHPVSDNAKITAKQYEDLFIDLVRARIHQVGANNFSVGNTVKGSGEVGTGANKIELSYINQLESLMSDIENNKFNAHPSQIRIDLYNTGSGHSDRRTSAWNTTLQFEVQATFANTRARREFFNAGGEIRLQAALNGETNAKSDDWAGLLKTAGIIRFAATQTRQSVSYNSSVYNVVTNPNVFSVGNFALSTGYQLIYRKFSNAATVNNQNYTGNFLEIYAREVNGSTLRFKMVFSDTPTDGNIDNLVIGETTVDVESAVPDGSVQIGGSNYTTVKLFPPIFNTITSINQ